MRALATQRGPPDLRVRGHCREAISDQQQYKENGYSGSLHDLLSKQSELDVQQTLHAVGGEMMRTIGDVDRQVILKTRDSKSVVLVQIARLTNLL